MNRAVPLAFLGGTALIATIVIVSRKRAGASPGTLPQLANDALHAKVLYTISTATSPAALRTLAAGLVKQGGMAEAAAANIKATTLDKGAAAVATAQALPTANTSAQAVVTKAVTQASQPTIQTGSTGPAVLQWQGILLASGIQVAVDGQFGPATKAATQGWQTAHGLAADGIVGPQTWAKANTP